MKTIRLLFNNEVIQVLNLSEEQSRRFDNCLSRKSCSDGIENSSISTSDGGKNSPSISDGEKKSSHSTSDSQRNSPSISDGQRNSPSISDGEKNSSPSTSDNQRISTSTSEKSESDNVFPRWVKTAKRGRKSSSKTAASHCANNQNEPVFGEKELVDTLMHLSALSNRYSIDSAKKERRIADKKRKFKDTNIVPYTEDGLKKARIENNRDEILIDSAKKTISEATHKKIPTLSTGSRKFSCDHCGKSFSCHQALGGHKSSCNSNFSIREVGESAMKGLMRNKNNQIDKSPKKCRICGKRFLTGWALGGHQRSHKTGQVEPSSRSSVSPPKEITYESLHLINSFTSSVPEAQEESLHLIKSSAPEAQEDIVADKKMMKFDLNEVPPEHEDEFDE